MPTLSASDYTRFLKYRAANVTPIRPAIQTRENVALSQSIINANLLTSQAALAVTPSTTLVTTLSATVTAATATPVSSARSNIITSATAGTDVIQYLTAAEHGLQSGDVVTIADVALGTLSVTPNQVSKPVTVTGTGSFTIDVAGVTGSSPSTSGRIVGRAYYTTGVAHGLVVGDVVTIAGVTTFSATNATVVGVPTATTFALSTTATGTAVSGQTGTISDLVYYTTNSAHGLYAAVPNVSVSGLSAFNVYLQTVYRAPTTTVFILQTGVTGSAITGQSGVLTTTSFTNRTTAITTNARVQPVPVVAFRSTDKAKSTLSFAGTSGALGSSAVARPGGIPTGFKNSQGSYTRLPQQAGW